MFESGVQTGEAELAGASLSELAAGGVVFTRLKNQAAAREVLAAFHLGRKVYEQVLADVGDHYRRKMPDKAALREVSWHFGVPAATAGRWMSLGGLLAELPQVRAAFLAGDLSESRVSVITHAIAGAANNADNADADAEDVDGSGSRAVQEAALALAGEASTNTVLAEQLEELVIALDPDAAAQAREEYAARNQNVRFGKELYGQAWIGATVPLADARYLQSRITGLLNHFLCGQDPREAGEQRVAALAAIMRGHTTLACRCGTHNCQAPAHQQPDPEPEPDADPGEDQAGENQAGENQAGSSGEVVVLPVRAVVEVVTDAQTLAGLTGDLVPYVQGYGVIDPALARELATDATWQGLYTESTRFERRRDPTAPTGQGAPFMVGRRRQGARVNLPTHLASSGGGSGPILLRSRPPNPVPIDPTGHGGLLIAPAGALTYAPSEALRRTVAHLDRHCRGPYCARPVAHCHLDHPMPFDHPVPFDHDDPRAGGWSILDNLAPLCIPCHHFKHLGIWIPTMATDRAIIWHHTTTGTTIITHP